MSYKHKKGVQAKLLAHHWLLEKGYQVLQEDTGQYPVDLVGIHLESGRIRCFEVKTMAMRSNGTMIHRILTEKQKELEIRMQKYIEIIYVDLENRDTYIARKNFLLPKRSIK